MTVLIIVALLLGTAFTLFGSFIYFGKRYDLINGFVDDLKSGRRSLEYAKRVGLIEFVIGIACLLIGIAIAIFG